jgi:hypothetical protein
MESTLSPPSLSLFLTLSLSLLTVYSKLAIEGCDRCAKAFKNCERILEEGRGMLRAGRPDEFVKNFPKMQPNPFLGHNFGYFCNLQKKPV